MILAEYEKSDLSQVATAHLIRLIIIITLFPFIIVNLYPAEALELEKFDYMSQNHWDLVLLIIASLIFSLLAEPFRFLLPIFYLKSIVLNIFSNRFFRYSKIFFS